WKNRPTYYQLRLARLAIESVGELLDALLGSEAIRTPLKAFLIERTRGNPFFIEEIVRALVDTGVLEGTRGSYRLTKPFSTIDVPPTVRAVLAARVDALPPAEKRLLQEAAVIGQDVPFALLHTLSGLREENLRSLLDSLQDSE